MSTVIIAARMQQQEYNESKSYEKSLNIGLDGSEFREIEDRIGPSNLYGWYVDIDPVIEGSTDKTYRATILRLFYHQQLEDDLCLPASEFLSYLQKHIEKVTQELGGKEPLVYLKGHKWKAPETENNK